MKFTHADFERVSVTLKSLADGSHTTAEQSEAIKLAAQALLFVVTGHQDEFTRFLASLDAPLSPEEEARIRKLDGQ
jgi:hypothetical protein